MAIVPTAGWLLVVELSNLAMYAFSRVILGAYRSPTRGRPVRGPGARPQPALRAGRARSPCRSCRPRRATWRAASERRLRELALRGTRYTLALFVPLCVTLMVLAEPILDVWLGDRYGEGATALAILVSYWLLYGGLVVTPGFLVGAGRARTAGLVFALRRRPEPGAVARPHARARHRGPGARHGDPVLPGVPAAAPGRAVGIAARRSGSSRGAPGCPPTRSGWCWRRCSWRCGSGSSRRRCPRCWRTAAGGVLAYWAAFYGLVLSAERAGALQRLSSDRSGAERSRSEVWKSMPSGHLMPTSGSSKRKPDSAAGS